MKLEMINFWFIALCVSVSYPFVYDYRFGNTLYSPPKIEVSFKFIFWSTKIFLGTLRKNKMQKFFDLKI